MVPDNLKPVLEQVCKVALEKLGPDIKKLSCFLKNWKLPTDSVETKKAA